MYAVEDEPDAGNVSKRVARRRRAWLTGQRLSGQPVPVLSVFLSRRMMKRFKENIHDRCLQLVGEKLNLLLQKQQDLAASVADETKSTAGDKYETARAMLHIEQEQLARQIAELKAQLFSLNLIDPGTTTQRITLGSLVCANDHYYYLSTALGKLQFEGKTIYTLSLQSPLGAQLKGLSAGDTLVVNGKKLTITTVS